MRNLNTIVSIIAFSLGAPVVIAVTLSLAFSPLQTMARASEPEPVFEVSDLLQPEPTDEVGAIDDLGPVSVDDAIEAESSDAAGSFGDDAACFDGESWTWEEGPACATQAAQYAEDADGFYSSGQLREAGVIYDGDCRYTWYSQRVLPGGGLDIEGRHVSDEGYVVDAQERIVVASSDLAWGTEVSVPFGSGTAIVLDSGCDAGTLDIYTDF